MKNGNIYFLLAFTCFLLQLRSQSLNIRTNSSTKIAVLAGFGLVHEEALKSDIFSLRNSVGFYPVLNGGSMSTDGIKIGAIAFFRSSLRWYFDARGRRENGRRSNNFANDYIGLTLIDNLTPILSSSEVGYPLNLIGLEAGLQRNIGSRGYFDFQILYGYDKFFDINSFEGKISLGLLFEIGFRLSK